MSSLDGRQFPLKENHDSRRPVKLPDVQVDPVTETIDRAIIMIVQQAPGCPTVNIMGGIADYLARNSDTSEPIHPSWIPSRLEALAEIGEITRLLAQDGNGHSSEYTYYPKEWQFQTTPRTQFLGNYKRPPKLDAPLSPDHQLIIDSFLNLLNQFNSVTRLNIVTQYCERCGELKEGHFCNE